MLLGHVQVSPDQQHWCVCPLTLVSSEAEKDTVFVCGQQTAAVRRDLGLVLGVRKAKVNQTMTVHQGSPSGPTQRVRRL